MSETYSTTELGQMFDMPAATARARLANAPVADTRGRSKLYTIKDAAPYLVPPSDDLESIIKAMRPDDLPVRLHDSFWGGQLKRQKYQENAEDLWRTQDVEAAFGAVFMLFRENIALWAETVERQEGVTDEQRIILVNLTDNLMATLHEKIEALTEKTDHAWGVEKQEDEDAK